MTEHDQLPNGGPAPPTPRADIARQESAAGPSLDHFEKIVDRAHREVEWVHSAYARYAGILATILVVGIGLATWLTYSNFRDMKSDVKDIVADVNDRVNRRISDAFGAQSIQDLIRKEAEGRVDRVAGEIVSDYAAKTLSPSLEAFDKRIAATESRLKTLEATALAELRQTSEYVLAVSAAQNDDRRAYDQLTKWANDKASPFSERAAQARDRIQDEHTSPYSFTYGLEWPEGVDPSKVSFDRLKATFSATAPQTRTSLIQYIWEQRGDIPKKDKMEFLVEVMKSDPSLRVVEQAARCFLQESKQPVKRLAADQMIDWWGKHKTEYLKDAAPKDASEKK